MINLLIVEDNLYYSKSLINELLAYNSNLRLYKISTDGNEALDIIRNNKNDIDVILLDLKLPKLNGIDILKYVEKENLIKFKNSIIVVSGETDLIPQVRNNPYLYTYINKISGFNVIFRELNNLIRSKENYKNSLDYRIYKELNYLNYTPSYLGTNYLKETIKLLYNYVNFEDVKIEKAIYKILAKTHKKSVNSIKTNIINATNLMCYDCESSKLNNYFGLCNNEKPTPKIVIMTIIHKIKYES